MEKLLDYIRESKAELRKVTWPTRKQLIASTVIVVLFSVMAAAYLGLVDLLLTVFFSKIL